MVSLCLSAAGLRFSILPSPTGDLGLPPGRLTAGVCPADPIGVYTFRMRKKMCGRGGCLLYAEIFGVLKPEPTTSSEPSAISHHRLNQEISMTYFSFDASMKIHFRSPVRPSPDPGLPPGSGIPLDFSDGFAQIVTDPLHAPDGDGIEHYPGFILRTTSLMRPRVALIEASVACSAQEESPEKLVECFRHEGEECPRCEGSEFRGVKRCAGCGEVAGSVSGGTGFPLMRDRRGDGRLYHVRCLPGT